MTIFTKIQIFAFSFILLFYFFSSSPVLAVSIWDSTGQQNMLGKIGQKSFSSGIPTDPKLVVANAIKVFLGFLGIIFMILILIAGYKYMMAGGNAADAGKAVNSIKIAIIGLLIILAAYALTDFIIKAIVESVVIN